MPNQVVGYMGKLLRIDLTTGKTSDTRFDEQTFKDVPRGTALGARILYDEVKPGVEWNSPQNQMILASRPLGGTKIGGSGGFSLVTKGAMTNGATSSQANGFFGA